MEVAIKIKGTEYRLPEEATAHQWSLISLLPNDKKHTIQTILDCSKMDLITLTEEEIQQVYEFTMITLKGIQETAEPIVSFETLEEMTFGQWCDLDAMAHIDANVYIAEIITLLTGQEAHDMPLSVAIPTLRVYLDWRAQVYQRYRNLFGLDENEPEDTDEAPTDDIHRVWYNAIMMLADDNFSNVDLVVEKPYKAAFNYMAYKKEKTQKEIEELKKIQKR